jgi:hypothetical protein
VKDRFCPVHIVEWTQKCAVSNCERKVEAGFRTCNLSEHRKLEDWLNAENKAMFQLRHRLARIGALHSSDSVSATENLDGGALGSTQHADEFVEVDNHGVCDGKPATGNKPSRAQFGRKRTHNEELCVASCGVILGRATFYGSEAPNGVRVRPQNHSTAVNPLIAPPDISYETLPNESIVT